MKAFRLSLLCTAVLWAVAPVHADQTRPLQGIRDNSPQLFAIQGATVHTEPGKSISNATVLVEHGKITAVGENVEVPSGYQRIDAYGYDLYPGFIDAYSSYGLPKAAGPGRADGPVYQADRVGGNAANMAIRADKVWAREFTPDADSAKTLRQQGFTVVQTAQFDGIARGQAVVASTGDGLPGDLILNANGSQFMSFDPGSSTQSYPSSLMGSIALLRQNLADANWYRDARGKTDWRFFREAPEYNAALEALGKIQSQGGVFETSNERNLLRADALFDQFSLSNVAMVGSGYEYARVDAVKAANRTVIVPVAYPGAPAVAKIEDMADVSLADLRHWERAPGNLASLEKAGVRFALTSYKLEKTDQFWPNVRKAVQYGLSKDAALAALTTVPAGLIGMQDRVGRIAPGYQADLVFSKGDVFSDGDIIATWTRGHVDQIKPLKVPAFAGSYPWDLSGTATTLELTGEGDKLAGKVKVGDKETDLGNVQQHRQNLSFTLTLKDVNGRDGVLQFSGELVGAQLTGTLLQPDGSSARIALNRTGLAKADDKDEPAKVSFVSPLTYPNQAFGLAAPAKQQNVHIKNATVWTSDKAGKLENTDVLVEDGKFVEIGKNLKTPSGFAVIDATGMHLTPGIIDEHSHIAIEAGVNEGSDAVTSEVAIGDVVLPDDINIYRGLAGGTTTAQLLHGSANPIGGQAQIIQLRWGVTPDELKFKGAPASIKFALGENVKQSNWGDNFTSRYPQSRVGVETTIREAFQAAKEYKAAWAAYNDLSSSEKKRVAPPRVDYRLQTLVEILDKKRFIHTHSYVASEILMLIHLADEVGFKVNTFTHILEGYKVADEMAKHGASASTFADWWAYKMEVQDAIPTNTCLMASRGVVVSINSDSPDLQRRLNQEAAKSMKYCDMSEEEALKLATINPAIQLRIDNKVGSITEGKQADFVLWSSNPLSVYAKAMQTWIDGTKYFDRAQDAVEATRVTSEKQRLVQKVLAASDEDKAGSGGVYKSAQPIWHCEDNGNFLKLAFGHQH